MIFPQLILQYNQSNGFDFLWSHFISHGLEVQVKCSRAAALCHRLQWRQWECSIQKPRDSAKQTSAYYLTALRFLGCREYDHKSSLHGNICAMRLTLCNSCWMKQGLCKTRHKVWTTQETSEDDEPKQSADLCVRIHHISLNNNDCLCLVCSVCPLLNTPYQTCVTSLDDLYPFLCVSR